MPFNLRNQATAFLSLLQAEVSVSDELVSGTRQVTYTDGIGCCLLSDVFIIGIQPDVQRDLGPVVLTFPEKCWTIQLPVVL